MARHITNIKKIRQKTEPHFIILSAGIGSKSKLYGVRALWEINNKPLILHQIDTIREAYPNSDITVVLGFESEKVIPKLHDVHIIESDLYETEGQTHSLRLALLSILSPLVVIVCGDMYFNCASIENITDKNKILTDSLGRINQNKVGVRGNKIVESLSYSWVSKFGGIFSLLNNELNLFKALCLKKNNSKLMLYEILEQVIEDGGKFIIHEPDNALFKEINKNEDTRI